MGVKTVIIVPAYEPPDGFYEYAATISRSGEAALVVVDDGSGEAYGKLFARIGSLSGVTLLRHECNRGKGAAMKTALAYCRDKYGRDSVFVFADCDGQHKLNDVMAVAAEAAKRPDNLIIGIRDFGDSSVPLRSRFGNTCMCLFFKLLYGVSYHDTQTGLRAASWRMIDFLLKVPGERFEYETEMLIVIQKEHIPFREIPISTVYESKENHVSHFNTLKDSSKVLGVLFRNIGAYFISSAVSAVVDVAAFFILSRFILNGMEKGVALLIATVSARLISSVINFFGNCVFVFKGKKKESIFRYYLLWLVQLSLSYGFTVLIGSVLNPGIWLTLIKGGFDLLLGICSYHIQRKWVFAGSEKRFFGLYFRFARLLASPFVKKYRVDRQELKGPCVYICRHLDMHGPYTVARSFPVDTHFMVLHCFFSFKECYRQYSTYTFTERKHLSGIRKRIAKIKAFACAVFIPPLIRSMKAIPVWRGADGKVITTFKKSVHVLDSGESIMVFPDVDYTSRNTKAGEIYEGFLSLEKLYYRRHGVHLQFVVLSINDKDKTVAEYSPIVFTDDMSFEDNASIVKKMILEELSGELFPVK